jgi:DNA-binding Lrp family transcriptional regulator
MVLSHDPVPARTHARVSPPSPEPLLDATDERIISLLCEDGRMSMRALAEQAGVSRASAYARVERLRSIGVISGFTVRLDPARLGLAVTAHVIVTVEQHGWRDALKAFRAMPEVAYCAMLAADFDVLLIVRAPDVATVRDVVLERLNETPGVRRTRTLLVLDDFTGHEADLLEAARITRRSEHLEL